MKKLFFLFLLLVPALGGFTQIPGRFSYQAIIRNSNSELVKSGKVGIKISILLGSESGAVVFAETHTVETNENGLINLEIGGGSILTGNVLGIDWSTGLYFLKTETDPAGGTNYSIAGTSQLLSVPYALYSGNNYWVKEKENIYFESEKGMVGIGTANPGSPLDVNGILRASSPSGKYFAVDAGNKDQHAYLNFNNENKTSKMFLQMNGINKVSLLNSGRLGIGTDTPTQLLEVNGSAVINENLIVKGVITGELDIDSIHVSRIVGLLGQGYSMIFPDIINNLVNFEIEGVLASDLIMISTLGFEIERISIPTGIDSDGIQMFREEAGLSMEFPIVFETGNADDISKLKNWFDGDKSLKSLSIITEDLGGTERYRWNCYEYKPDKYEPGIDGRTRFTIIHSLLPNNICHIEKASEDFGDSQSFNIETDKLIEIDGVSFFGFSPAFELDEINRTITLTMDFNEGAGIYDWARSILMGTSYPKNISVIETTNGTTETGRMNYFECIPIKWEVISGFGLNNKTKSRVVIAYGFREAA